MGQEKSEEIYSSSSMEEQGPCSYEIRVEGRKSSDFWIDWFGGMPNAVDTDRDETLLTIPVVDQAELYGLLSRLRNRGLVLISVRRL